MPDLKSLFEAPYEAASFTAGLASTDGVSYFISTVGPEMAPILGAMAKTASGKASVNLLISALTESDEFRQIIYRVGRVNLDISRAGESADFVAACDGFNSSLMMASFGSTVFVKPEAPWALSNRTLLPSKPAKSAAKKPSCCELLIDLVLGRMSSYGVSVQTEVYGTVLKDFASLGAEQPDAGFLALKDDPRGILAGALYLQGSYMTTASTAMIGGLTAAPVRCAVGAGGSEVEADLIWQVTDAKAEVWTPRSDLGLRTAFIFQPARAPGKAQAELALRKAGKLITAAPVVVATETPASTASEPNGEASNEAPESK